MVKLWSLALALMVGAGCWSAPVSAQSSDVEKLQKELSTLRSEMDELKSVQRQGADEEPALATKLKGHVFSWSTEDGKFSLTMSTRVQFRVTYNDERGQDAEGPSDPNSGDASNGRDFWNFRVARAKTTFSGNIFEKEFKYRVVLNWTEASSNQLIEEAFFTWAKYKEINVSAGQAKVPYSYQFMISSGKQQFIDRSVVSNTFNQSWGKGIWVNGQIGSDTPWVKYWFGIYNGVLKGGTDFRNADRALTADTFSTAVDADLMPALRVETHPLGNVEDDMVDMRDREAGKKVLFSVGIGMNWFTSRFSNAALRPTSASPGSGRSTSGQDTISLTIDGHFRFYGLSVNIEYHFRDTEFHNFRPLRTNTDNRALLGDLTDQGFLFEAGFMILPKQFDVGFRFGWVNSDEYWVGGSTSKFRAIAPDSTEIGLVVGYYLGGHNLKIQADFTYVTYQLADFTAGAQLNGPGGALPSRSASSFANDNADWLNVWQFRVQIQWIF